MTAINIGMPRNWRDKAACVSHDPDLWFPGDGLAGRNRAERATDICRACPVRDECLQENLHIEYGIFGGLDARERKKLRQ